MTWHAAPQQSSGRIWLSRCLPWQSWSPAAFSSTSLPLAVIGHEGGTVLVVLNGLRLLAAPMRQDRQEKSASASNSGHALSAPALRRQSYRRKIAQTG
jgi:hypothetical protein